jgi:hypothetical protein
MLKIPTHPPARTIEQRQKQLNEGIRPEFGRGAGGGTCPLPDGAGWIPHTGNRQRMRNYNQAWEKFEKKCAADEFYRATRDRLLDWLVESDTPMPELAAKAIVFAAMVNSEVRAAELAKNPPKFAVVMGTDWVDELNNALNQLESNKDSKDSDIQNDPGIPPETPEEAIGT